MADQGTQVAMADHGTQAAMADPGTHAAMADPGTPAAMEGSPPPKHFLVEAHHLWGVLRRRGCRGALWKRGRRAGQGQRRPR